MHAPHDKAEVDLRPHLSSADPPPDSIPTGPVAPITPHRAYCAGLEAARNGDDLSVIVHTALLSWPMGDDLGELAELITCAALGFQEGGRL